MKRNRSVLLNVLLSAVAVTACSEQDSNPVAPKAPSAVLVPGAPISALKRVLVKATDESATATVGARGGSISVGGVTLRIPPRALTENTEITVTVPAGDLLQVQFEPHGLQFNKPATVEIGLNNTLAGVDAGVRGALSAAYFLGDLEDGQTRAEETFAVHVAGSRLFFKIHHFSGYCVVNGRSDGCGCDP